MSRHASLFAAALLLAATARAGLDVRGGRLLLNGGGIRTDACRIGGRLEGNGIVDAPAAQIGADGAIAPRGGGAQDVGALRFTGSLLLDGTYACTVASHETLDLVSADGPVSGAARLLVEAADSAIPLGQTVVAGSAGSDLSAFALAPESSRRFALSLPAPHRLALTDRLGDTDSDGLPDWWETAYFGNRTDAAPAHDPDGDSSTNAQEFGAGTHPLDPSSVFALDSMAARDELRLSWHSVPGKSYAVHASASPDFHLGHAIDQDLPATPPLNVWTHPMPAAAAVFFRVVVQP